MSPAVQLFVLSPALDAASQSLSSGTGTLRMQTLAASPPRISQGGKSMMDLRELRRPVSATVFGVLVQHDAVHDPNVELPSRIYAPSTYD
jgi:hypothetical protein